MKTAHLPITDTSVGLEPDPGTGAFAHDVWRDLLASNKRKTQLANSLGGALGARWEVSWQDGRLVVQRQPSAPADSAFSKTTSLRGALGSPKVICDGHSIFADREPDNDDLNDDLAYVMAKIAKYLNWTRVVTHGSELFRDRFQHYALHERDLYGWAFETARTLREHRPANTDWDSIAEELEDLGISQERALASHLRVLLAHLLKWTYHPSRRSKSWRLSIQNSRDELKEMLDRSPGLRQKIPALFSTSYRRARRDAAGETSLDEGDFPKIPPWQFGQVMDETFWPDSPTRPKN